MQNPPENQVIKIEVENYTGRAYGDLDGPED